MSPLKIVGFALITLGILGLAYEGFTYTQTRHEARIGPLELSVEDKETINIPVWAGALAIAVGGFAILVPRKT